ncbi:MAG: cyclic nucleotide-binding domain-containing protein [Acidobacteriota bacterium]
MSRSVFADFTAHYDAGDVLFSSGDAGTTVFVVQSGSIELVRDDEGGSSAVYALMEKGDFFGEMSLLAGTPRSFTARAAEASDVIEISPALFDRMIRGNIEIAVRMLRKLSARLSTMEQRLAQFRAQPRSSPAPPAPIPAGGAQRSARPAATPPPRPAPAIAKEPGQGNGTVVEPHYLVETSRHEVFTLPPGTACVGRFDPVTGTRPEVDLTLLDLKRSVSRRHAVITIDDGGCLVTEEVGALNGTTVNGTKLTPGEPVPVQDGDEVAFGSVVLTFQSAAP